MKNLTKRFIATMLVLMMVVTLLPTFASAEGTADWSEYVSIERKLVSYGIDGATDEHDVNIVITLDGETVATGTARMYTHTNLLTITLNDKQFCLHQIDSIAVSRWPILSDVVINGDKSVLTCKITDLHIDEGLVSPPTYTINLTSKEPTHDFVVSESKDATCTEKGNEVSTCTRCGETVTREFEVLGHNYGDWTYVEGSDTAADHSDSQHSRVCANDASHVETASCTFNEVTEKYVAPTLESEGSKTYQCSACGHTYTESIPQLTPETKFFTVTYEANGGEGGPGVVNDVPEQDNYSLSAAAPTHAEENGVAVAFIGWSETQDTKLYTKDDTAPACVSTIKVDGNKTVYAVWGLDSNGDGKADVTEATYILTYDANGGDANVPAAAKYLSGEKVTLDTSKPTHADAEGKKVVFAGWTAEPVSGILSKGDAAPEYLTEVTIADADITVYAAWGYDENGDGEADVNEETYTLTYDANGGTEAPEAVSGLLAQKDYILSTQAPKHDAVDGKAVVFIGWTAEKDSKIYAKDETLPAAITKTDIAGDTTVYAVYGYDEDSNGKPDVTETYVTLTYAANGGEGAPASETKALSDGSAAFTVSSTAPTRSEYTFKGWSTAADGKVQYQAGDKLTLTENTTLYAVWELNPLVKYTITYNANGGKDAPAAQSVESRTGSGVLVLSKDVPTREGYIFCGWSQVTSGYAQFQPGDRVEIKGDVTLYALWVDKASIPKTGDESNLALWAALAALSVIGMGAAIIIGKKQKEN